MKILKVKNLEYKSLFIGPTNLLISKNVEDKNRISSYVHEEYMLNFTIIVIKIFIHKHVDDVSTQPV